MTASYRFALCLLILFCVPYVCAQPESPTDSLIQMWRWESEDGYSTVDVCSPQLLLFEGNAYEFELFNGAFHFVAGRTSIPYRYDEARTLLTLIFPEGPPLEYHRTIGSVYLRRLTNLTICNGRALYGRFCSVAGIDGGHRAIAFWSNGEFDFSPGAVYASVGTGVSAALGTAVLYGDAVIMSFYEGQVAEAQVIERNGYGEVARIEYAKEEYARDECESIEPPLPPTPPPPPTPPIPQPDPSPAPGPIDPPRPSPSPGRPGGNIRGPVSSTASSPSSEAERPSGMRPIGNTQGSVNSSSSGSAGGSSTSQSSGGRPTGNRR